MREQQVQSKIMKYIESIGGTVVNGQYTKAGEADLQCGVPTTPPTDTLLYVAIEVKTPSAYEVLSSGVEDVDGIYVITDTRKLKKHEALQIHKLNIVRKLGGLSLMADSVEMVQNYLDGIIE